MEDEINYAYNKALKRVKSTDHLAAGD